MKRFASFYLLFLLSGLLCLWPALSAGLHTDDWGWLALAHQLDNPLPSYYENILWGYFYRPTAMVFWWLSERVAGDNSQWHYLITVLLHAGSATCLAMLVRANGRPMWIAATSGLLYISAPAIAGSSLWLSSRNEMLALASGLFALFLLEREIFLRRHRGIAVSTFLLIALTSKESAYLFVFAALFRIFLDGQLRHGLSWKTRCAWLFFLVTPLAIAAGIRSLVIIPIGPEANAGTLWEVLRLGLESWLRLWPDAVSGLSEHRLSWLYLATLAPLAAYSLSVFHQGGKTMVWMMIALMLIIAPGLLQAPITSLVLVSPDAAGQIVNLRFYATSSLGIVLLLGMCLPIPGKPWLIRGALVFLLLIGAVTSLGLAKNWRDATRPDDALVRRLAAGIALDIKTPHCRVLIRGDIPDSIAPWIDPALKSQWPRQAASQHCGFFVENKAAHYQILPLGQCAAGHLPDSEYRQFLSRPLYRRFGSICQTGMLPPDQNSATRVIRWWP